MAKIFGELKRAQFENTPSNPLSGKPGMAYYNTLLSKIRYFSKVGQTETWKTLATLEDSQEFTGEVSLNSANFGLDYNTISSNQILSLQPQSKIIQKITTGDGSSTTLAGIIMLGGGGVNRLTIILNGTTSPITIKDGSSLIQPSSKNIWTGTGGDIKLLPYASILLVFNTTEAKWQVVGGGSSENSPSTQAEAALIAESKLTPTSIPPKLIQRITTSSATLSTIVHTGGSQASQLILVNTTTTPISIINNATTNSATSSYGILTGGSGGSIQLPANASMILIFDPIAFRWRVVGVSEGGGASSVTAADVVGLSTYVDDAIDSKMLPYVQGAIDSLSTPLPKLSGVQVLEDYLRKLRPIHAENANAAQWVGRFIPDMPNLVSSQFSGGVYSPAENKIYLVPGVRSDSLYYVDCNKNKLVSYSYTGVTLPSYPYNGGVYCPVKNRIYLAPASQNGDVTGHYIDCSTGELVSYEVGSSVSFGAYAGGVYSPTQKRIYFAPSGQANKTHWHYIDCETGAFVSYANNIAGGSSWGSNGAVYSPTQNRIYFMTQHLPSGLFYVDCDTGAVVKQEVTSSLGGTHYYSGGVFSPTQNRIYLVPSTNSNLWYYIDCNTGQVESYASNSVIVSSAYRGGVYSPLHNRIYFVPYEQATESTWHYIDCNTSQAVAYPKGGFFGSKYQGGVYSPIDNKIYFIPYIGANAAYWACVGSTALPSLAPHYFGSTILSNNM